MPQCIVVSLRDRDDWIDRMRPHPKGMRALGLHMPQKVRPSLIHPTRADAETEAARLAGENPGCRFAVFELVGAVEAQSTGDDHGSWWIKHSAAVVPRWAEVPEV